MLHGHYLYMFSIPAGALGDAFFLSGFIPIFIHLLFSSDYVHSPIRHEKKTTNTNLIIVL